MALKCLSETIILEDIFTQPVTSVNYTLVLTEKILFVCLENKGKTEIQKIFLSDIVGCHIFRRKNGKSKNETNDLSAHICIYAYPLKTFAGILSKHLRRDKRTLNFQLCKYQSIDVNYEVVKKWHRAINCLLRGIPCTTNGEVNIPDSVPASKKFLFLINPKSGPGKAYQIFKEWVIPILVESDTQYDLLITDRANCARDYMKKADISQWNGIVVVSGDGLLFEVYNGLMCRPDWRTAIKTPIGIIPGGSGNGLARAINYAAGEPYDGTSVIPSVLNIVRGRVAPMDLVQVETPKEYIYSFLSIGWGLMADIDIESERLRAIGEARFAIWAVIRAIGLRKYKGKLSYLPVHGYTPKDSAKFPAGPKPKRSKTVDCKLAWREDNALYEKGDRSSVFKSKSLGAYDSDIDKINSTTVQLLKFKYDSQEFQDPLSPDEIVSENSESEFQETLTDIPLQLGTQDTLYQDEPEQKEGIKGMRKYCPPLDSPVPEDWIVREEDFILVYACHQTHLSAGCLFAPDAKLDDGIMWLIVIKSGITRTQVMHFLVSLQTGDHVNIPYVDAIPVHAFRLEPHNSDGHLTVDGEVVPCSPIQAEVMPSIARVMSR